MRPRIRLESELRLTGEIGAEDGRAPVFLDVFDHQLRSGKVADARTLAGFGELGDRGTHTLLRREAIEGQTYC